MSLTPTGASPSGASSVVRTLLWRGGADPVEDFPLEQLSEHLGEVGTLVWVDVRDPSPELLARLAEELSLDPHAVEDSVASAERAKATRHATHTFVTAYATHLRGSDPAADPLSSRLEISRVSCFVLPRGLVTVRRGDALDLEDVVQRWADHRDLLKQGAAALLHGLLDAVVDGHFDTIQRMDDAIESLEDGLFDERGSVRELQQRTYRLRKELVELRRVVLPMREVVATVMRHRADVLGGEGNDLDGWYADLYDHVLRASEWTESLRDMVTTVFETNLALQDARLNAVMKQLTAWAAVIAVPTAVTGWFGMNVAYPGFGRISGFVASTVVIVGLALSLFGLFRRRGWI
jgi:magnesium transporter